MKPLKYHPALIGLSYEHHGSLSLCVRLLRAPDQGHQAELELHFVGLGPHFLEEETIFAPYWDKIDPALQQHFEGDHTKLHTMVMHPEYMSKSWDKEFTVTLRDHVHSEGRELFPVIESFLPLPGNM